MKIEVYDNFLPTEVFMPIKDYIFSGVMGYQRLSKSRNDSYTSGMKKLFD